MLHVGHMFTELLNVHTMSYTHTQMVQVQLYDLFLNIDPPLCMQQSVAQIQTTVLYSD